MSYIIRVQSYIIWRSFFYPLLEAFWQRYPQSRRFPTPSLPPQPVQTDQARHIHIIETLKPRRDASDLIRVASAPVKTDQNWHPPTSNPTPKTRRDASDLIRVASAPENTAQTWHPPTSNPTLKPWRDVSDLIRVASAPENTAQTRHTCETVKPRRDVADLIRVASAPENTTQTWHPPTSNPTLKPRRDVSELIWVASAPAKKDQTWHPPTRNPTLKPRRDTIELIRPSLDPSSCPHTSSGKTTTLPTSRTRPTTKDNEYYLHLQHISPPDALWILYKAIEGDLTAAQYTRTEIREYIRDLQSHNEPSPPRTSTKCLPTPEESYVARKGHFFNESSRTALTKLDPKERSTPHQRYIRKKKRQPSVKASQHTADNPQKTSSQMPQKEQIKTLPDMPKHSWQ
jgi:hypothetical protein